MKPEDVTAVLAALVVLAVTAASVVIRWQARRDLRRPTKTQSRAIAAPVGRILMRRADLSMLGPDLVDILTAATATGEYIGDGPLLTTPGTRPGNPGIPPNLQETHS